VKDKLDVMVRELSLGERMKLELICALLHAPKVLFLDEPTIGLDVTSQQKVRDFLRDYNKGHGIVTMLTSHYMGDIEALCPRVIIIDHGKIFFDGPLSRVIERYATHKVIGLTFAEAGTRDLGAFGEIVATTPHSVKLRVPRPRATELCRELLGRFPVTDLNVEEAPIEDVIRQLFAEHSSPGAQAATAASRP
jgi:ABC-2 type transport system ATP-binding protein